MNILIIASDFKPMTGGIAEYTHQMARFLTMYGNRVVVFAPHMSNDKECDASLPYITHRYDEEALYSVKKPFRYLREIELLRKIIQTHKIDIIIGNHLCTNPYIYWLVAKIMNKPSCVFLHGRDVMVNLTGVDGLKKRAILKTVDRVFCNTHYTQQCAIKMGMPYDKSVIVHPGFHSGELKSGNSKSRSPVTSAFSLQDKKVIFTLGRLTERKGQDTIIRAMPEILRSIPDAVYLIGGDGPYEDTLKRLAEDQGVSRYVIFAGRVKEDQRQSYYDACDIFIMANRELDNGDAEAFGMVFLEANACGKPVIGGRSGGVAESVQHNQTGLLVNPTDIRDVAEAVTYLLKRPDVARQMGEKGRQIAEENFSWQKLVPGIEQELLALAG